MVEKKDREGKEKSRGGRAERRGAQTGGLSRANPTMRFAFLCTGVVRNFAVARVFRPGCFSGTRRKTGGHFKFIRRFRRGPSLVDRKGQRDGAAIYRRFPAPHAVVLRNYFPCPVPLGVDQSVHGAKFLNGAGRVMSLKFGRDYPCKLKKISICTRKSHGNESFHRAAIRFELIRFFSKVCLRLSPPRIPMIDNNREN